jgi:hypothetical protein
MLQFYIYNKFGLTLNLIQKISKIKHTFRWLINFDQVHENMLVLSAKPLISQLKGKKILNLSEIEFKVFSQWGDDGIIQWLINNLQITNDFFIEFGVEDYSESNTRFLLLNNNWSGLVMDGSNKNISKIKKSYYYWRYDLTAREAFVNCDNINELILSQLPDKKVGLLHIDIDGNDYWIWEKINAVTPEIVIMEYNSLFGKERSITVPYNKKFIRSNAHYSNLYFGASLKALINLAHQKGYSFIGCNSSGNNSYFVRKELLNEIVREITIDDGFVSSKFRESRNKKGELTFLSKQESLQLISGLPVYDTDLNKIVDL